MELTFVQGECLLDHPLPVIESETGFLLRLVRKSADPWDIWCLQTVSDQMSSLLAESRSHLGLPALREKEAARIEHMFALCFF